MRKCASCGIAPQVFINSFQSKISAVLRGTILMQLRCLKRSFVFLLHKNQNGFPRCNSQSVFLNFFAKTIKRSDHKQIVMNKLSQQIFACIPYIAINFL